MDIHGTKKDIMYETVGSGTNYSSERGINLVFGLFIFLLVEVVYLTRVFSEQRRKKNIKICLADKYLVLKLSSMIPSLRD